MDRTPDRIIDSQVHGLGNGYDATQDALDAGADKASECCGTPVAIFRSGTRCTYCGQRCEVQE